MQIFILHGNNSLELAYNLMPEKHDAFQIRIAS